MAVSKRLRFEVLRRDNHRCRYCGVPTTHAQLVIDHVVPRALGGKDDFDNLVASCQPCNIGKASTVPDPQIVLGIIERSQVDAFALTRWRETQFRAGREGMSEFPDCQYAEYCGDPLCRLQWAAYVSGWYDHTDIAPEVDRMKASAEQGVDRGTALDSA